MFDIDIILIYFKRFLNCIQSILLNTKSIDIKYAYMRITYISCIYIKNSFIKSDCINNIRIIE